MKIKVNNNINNEIVSVAKSVNESLRMKNTFRSTENDTSTSTIELKPPVSFTDAQYVFENSSYVAKCCRIKASDIVYNDLTVTSLDETIDEAKLEIIQKTLEESADEFYNMMVDYLYAGLGVLEYAYGTHRFKVKQIPVNTVKIIKINYQGQFYFLLEQKVNTVTNYFKIMGETYPPSFSHYANQELGYCSLFGGDNFYEFFATPVWVQERKKIFTEIAISDKNYNTIENGNIATGILNVNLEPQIMKPVAPLELDENGEPIAPENVKTREQVIADELVDNDSGIAVIFTESNRPISLDFVKIENDNYDYLDSREDKCERSVLNCYNIPLTRMMINTEKESMNSNKTQSIWEIYTIELKNCQRPFKQFQQELVKDLYSIDVKIDLSVPIFSDRREIEVNSIIVQWQNGILNLQQTITALADYSPVIDLKDYDFTVNRELWEYRQIQGYYELLNEVDMLQLEEIENDINKIA